MGKLKKDEETKRRADEKEMIQKIKTVVPLFKKKESKLSKSKFLRTVAGYMKFAYTFKNTDVEPLPFSFDDCLQTLLCSDEVNLFVCDGHLVMLFCSEFLFKSLGYQEEDIIGHKLSSLVYVRDRHNVESKIDDLKKEVVTSTDHQYRDFTITCRMMVKNTNKKTPNKYELVRITGSIGYRRELATKQVTVIKGVNGHLSCNVGEEDNFGTGIIIRGSVSLMKEPDFLSSQIDYMFIKQSEYRLVMNPDGIIVFACHRMVSIIGYQPEDVIGKSAYNFMLPADRQVSLYAHTRTLANSEGRGVIVHRLLDANKKIVYLESNGRLEQTGDTILFHTVATPLSEEEGERQRQEFFAHLLPHCKDRSVDELQDQVNTVANAKLLAAASSNVGSCAYKNFCSSDSNNSRLQPSTSSTSAPSTVSPSSHSVLSEFSEDKFLDITSIPSSSASTSLPSSSSSSHSQSPSNYHLSSQSLTTESQATQCLSDSPSSPHSLSINYPVNLNTMNTCHVQTPIFMSGFPTNAHYLQNQYVQVGANQLCGMNLGQDALSNSPRQINLTIITTQSRVQCTIPEQQSVPVFFNAPINHQQIIFHSPTQYQIQTENFNQDSSGQIVQNISGLDINRENQVVNIEDYVNFEEHEQDLKNKLHS